MADDKDGRRRAELIDGSQNVFDKWPPGESVQDLGAVRLHSRALTGREDDDVEVAHALVSCTPPDIGRREPLYYRRCDGL